LKRLAKLLGLLLGIVSALAWAYAWLRPITTEHPGLATPGGAGAASVGGQAVEAVAEPDVVYAPLGGQRDPLINPKTRRFFAVAMVAICVSPITLLLGLRMAHFLNDPLFGLYGVVVLLTTAVVMFIAFSFYRDPAFDPQPPGLLPFVSCLVAVKDDAEVVVSCIRSMLASDYPRFEVIVVDDGSTDGSTEKLRRLSREMGFRLIENEVCEGKKRALVRGVADAKGEIILFTDSDCVLHPQAMAQTVKAFCAHPDIGAASGYARALNADATLFTRIQDTWYDGQFQVWKATESVFGSVTCVSGPLAAFRREAVWNYFPAWAEDRFLGTEFRFATDRQLTGYVLGQQSMGKKLKRKHAESPFVTEIDYPERKWKVVFVRSARVWTNVPETLPKMFRQQARWKKSFIRNTCFTGTFFWRRGPIPSLLFYSHIMFVLATPLMALRHLLWLPIHGQFFLSGLYLCGVCVKGGIWAIAYRAQNPRDGRWIYRPLMSLMAALFFSCLLLYSIVTMRRQAWVRG
jgi:cellulose synthase/poly-beta-1,6-N-acetylglucosamine synthase-like glycosyltransferase